MTTSIIGLFESGDIASKVLGELTKAGFKKDAVEIIENVAASRITSRLVEAGYEKDKAESYGEAMQKGGALIVAEAPDDKADEALDMMRSFKALSPETLLEKLGNQTSEQTQSAQVIGRSRSNFSSRRCQERTSLSSCRLSSSSEQGELSSPFRPAWLARCGPWCAGSSRISRNLLDSVAPRSRELLLGALGLFRRRDPPGSGAQLRDVPAAAAVAQPALDGLRRNRG